MAWCRSDGLDTERPYIYDVSTSRGRLPVPDWSRPDFQWDDANEEHLVERHGVYPEEVEQVFYNGAHVRREGEFYYALGQNDAGRYLAVVAVLRGSAIRVISARPMNPRERRSYERIRKG